MGRQREELFARHGVLAVAFGVRDVANHVRDGQALHAVAIAFAAHAAIQRAQELEARRENLLIDGRERLTHGLQVLIQLIQVRMLGMVVSTFLF